MVASKDVVGCTREGTIHLRVFTGDCTGWTAAVLRHVLYVPDLVVNLHAKAQNNLYMLAAKALRQLQHRWAGALSAEVTTGSSPHAASPSPSPSPPSDWYLLHSRLGHMFVLAVLLLVGWLATLHAELEGEGIALCSPITAFLRQPYLYQQKRVSPLRNPPCGGPCEFVPLFVGCWRKPGCWGASPPQWGIVVPLVENGGCSSKIRCEGYS